MYWLLGHCRFAEGDKCVYAHDAAYLPAQGWWTDVVRLERMRNEFDDAAKADPLNLGAGRVSESILAEALVPLPWRKDLWAVASSEEEMRECKEMEEHERSGRPEVRAGIDRHEHANSRYDQCE